MKAVCIIAAYNEEGRIVPVIRGVRKFIKGVIVVDDGSKDKTSAVSKKAGAKVISYKVNRGKGYALRLGLKAAMKMKPDVIIILDADGQHDPKYIPDFIKKIKSGADYVYGKRDLSNYPLDRKVGNWGLKTLTNLLFPTGIQDTESGYRAMSTEAAKKLKLKGNRYEVEMSFAYEVWRNKFNVSCVSIKVPVFHKKFAVDRGIKNFVYLLKMRFGTA
ncbi:MAG: glycosyltransferase family 2 protein [Candidatus Aenigmatarchaeota archaeon]